MNILNIQATDDSPEVLLNHEKNIFEISGKSLPEDVASFYDPVLKWLEEYALSPAVDTIFTFKFTYFNTASSKIILDILMILEGIHAGGHPVMVKWYSPEYDEDMIEAGIEYSEMAEVPFEHIKYMP